MSSDLLASRPGLPAPSPAPPTPAAASAAPRALWLAALLRYGYDAAACLLLALPARNATVASGIAALPDAARALHLDGGVWLLELLRTQQASLLASAAPVLWSLLLLSGLALLPEWWLLRVLAAGAGVPGAPAGRALTRLGALALGTWSLRAAGWLSGVLLALFVRSQLQQLPDERLADLAAAAVLAATLLTQLGLSLLRDLVAVRLVQRGRRVLATLRDAARQLRARTARLALPYGAYRALGGALLLGAHVLSVALDRRGHGGAALAAVLLGLAARVALETLWLRWLMPRAAPTEGK